MNRLGSAEISWWMGPLKSKQRTECTVSDKTFSFLGIWSRNEVVRVNFEDRWDFDPGLANGLVGRSPPQGFEVLGEVVGGTEG